MAVMDMVDMVMEDLVMVEVMEAIMAEDTERDLLMLSPRLMLLLVMESALFLMAMLHPLLPMLLLLPSPSDMVDMVMELESGRDLLMLRLNTMDMAVMVDMVDMVDTVDTDMEVMVAMEVMAEDTERDLLMLRLTLPSSTDLTAMLPPLLPTDMLSLPPLSDPTPSLLTELEDMDMELMVLTGNSPKSKAVFKQLPNSKDDLKFPWM